MTALLVLLLLVAVLGALRHLMRLLHLDGYGDRPVPSSHEIDWSWLAPASWGGR
jgi:hypothetical protein